jgi:bacterioferritin-associated ferredoxin
LIVCHCNAKSDRDIRAAVQGGARCCKTVRRACRAGGDCGGCIPAIKEIISEEEVASQGYAMRGAVEEFAAG